MPWQFWAVLSVSLRFVPTLLTLFPLYQGKMLDNIGFIMSFLLVTLLFILFADLIPKRIGMINPERVALAVIEPVLLLSIKLYLSRWLGLSTGLANLILNF